MCVWCIHVCVCVVINSCCSSSSSFFFTTPFLLRDGRNRGHGALASGGARRARCRLAGPLRLLLLDALLDQVVGHVDGVRAARDGHDAVAGAGREDALLADLDVGPGQVLDLDQAAARGSWVNNKKRPDSVSLDHFARNSPF